MRSRSKPDLARPPLAAPQLPPDDVARDPSARSEVFVGGVAFDLPGRGREGDLCGGGRLEEGRGGEGIVHGGERGGRGV